MTIATGQQALAADILKHATADGYLRYTASTELTIASGAVTATANFYRVDTESDASTDDLDTITAGTGVADGHLLVLRAENGARTVVVKHNTGNIVCTNGVDQTLDDQHDALLLIYDGNLTKWFVFGFLGPLTVAAGSLASNAVTTAKILDANVTTAKLADGAVTADKLASAVAGSGLAGGAGTALSVNVDGTTIAISGDTLSVLAVPTGIAPNRQGGSSTIWASSGSTDYSATTARVQVGEKLASLAGAVTVTFPVAFSYAPLIFCQAYSGPTTTPRIVIITARSASQFSFNLVDKDGTRYDENVSWLAIGPQ